MSFKNGDVLLFKNRVGDKLKVKYVGKDAEGEYSSCIILQVIEGCDDDWVGHQIEEKEPVGLRTSFLSYIAPASLENK